MAAETYIYPQINRASGYAWNALYQEPLYQIGRQPVASCDVQVDGVMYTRVTYDPPLNDTEKAVIDGIMAAAVTSCQAPAQKGTRFIISDIYEKFTDFCNQMSLQGRIYFDESTPGSGVVDEIVIDVWNPDGSILSTKQVNQVKNAYAGMIRNL